MTGPTGEWLEAARARREAADWFSRLRADAAAADPVAFEAWRTADALNREAYDRLARQWDQSKFLANTSLGRGRDLGRAVAWHRRPSNRYAAVAAMLVLIVGATLLLRPGTPQSAVAYASKVDAIRTVTLADGSRVTLDRSSTLRVSYTPSERLLDLVGGRARFDVAHDPARPFVVRADGGSIVARGTIFDVEIRPGLVRVVLLRGSVEVRGGERVESGAGRSRMLAPGQVLSYSRDTAPSLPIAADPSESRWPSPMLAFDGTPLREAVVAFNGRNGVKLALGSDRVGNMRITGAFAADDPEGFAGAAAAMFRLDVRHEQDATILLQ